MNKQFDLQKDVEKSIQFFNGLTSLFDNGQPIVKGNFIAYDKSKMLEIEIYEISISFPKRYPYCFPEVIEISNKIPRIADRHIREKDGTLCFGNLQDEWKICKKGINLKWFLENILNNHLVREYYREHNGTYPTGERSHGYEGIWEGYYEIFKTDNKLEILKQLEIILQPRQWARNALCYCKTSEKKYKACHEKLEKQVFEIKKSDVQLLYRILKKDYETKNEKH